MILWHSFCLKFAIKIIYSTFGHADRILSISRGRESLFSALHPIQRTYTTSNGFCLFLFCLLQYFDNKPVKWVLCDECAFEEQKTQWIHSRKFRFNTTRCFSTSICQYDTFENYTPRTSFKYIELGKMYRTYNILYYIYE